MMVGKHDRLTYKKGTIDLSKLLDNRLIPRSANAREITLVTSKFRLIFSSNGLTYPSIRKRTSARRTARSRSITLEQNYVVRTRLSTYRKMTFLELCVAKQATSIDSIDEWSIARCLYDHSFRDIKFRFKNGRLPLEHMRRHLHSQVPLGAIKYTI